MKLEHPKDHAENPTTEKEALENARMAELLSQPITPEAKALIQDMLGRILSFEAENKPRKQKDSAKITASLIRGLGALVADVIAHAGNQASWGFMYRLKNRSAFSQSMCSNRSYLRLQELWQMMGWIEVKPGYYIRDDFEGESVGREGKAERLRAMPVLLELALAYGITPSNAKDHFRKNHNASFPVVVKTRSVRDKRGRKTSKQMLLPDSAHQEDKVNQIRELNAFLEQHSFNLPEVPQLRRTFHNGDDPDFDYDQGGRLYCVTEGNYQKMAKAERSEITIDGKPTIEVDVSSSFPRILHHLCGVSFPETEDIYAIEGIERMVVKKIVVARLGSEDWPKRWPNGFKGEYEKATGRKLTMQYKLKDVVNTVRERLSILEGVDQRTLGWAQLQYLESEAMLRSITTLRREYRVVALPIHDSLLVPLDFKQEAKEAIRQAYKVYFGSSPIVKEVMKEAA